MFQNSIKIMSKITFPLVTNILYYNKDVESGICTAFLINNENYFLTCAHVFLPGLKLKKDKEEIDNFEKNLNSIQNTKQKKAYLKKAKSDWIIGVSFYLPTLNCNIDLSNVNADFQLDLAVFKIYINFNIDETTIFPKFNKSNESLPGKSLCRLGYPFSSSTATFNDTTKSFTLISDKLALNQIPNECIITQFINDSSNINVEGVQRKGKGILTSSPGLRGQSGGPIFDSNSIIYGLQSFTTPMSLEINGIIQNKKDKSKISYHPQFMLLGVGTASQEICSFLDVHHIHYDYL